MMHFLLLQKLARVPLKKSFPPCYYHFRSMQIYFNASALHILYITSRISYATDLQILSGNISRRFPCSYPVVSDGFRRFPVVILGYPWLSLVIHGYLWLYLVILGYSWLYLFIYNSNICEIVCAFAIIISVICRNLLQSRPDKMTTR